MISDLSHSPLQSCHIWLTNPQELIQSQAAGGVKGVLGGQRHPAPGGFWGTPGWNPAATGTVLAPGRLRTSPLPGQGPFLSPAGRPSPKRLNLGSGFPIRIPMGSSKSLRLWRTRTPQCYTRDKPAGTPANLLTHQQASTRDTSKLMVCSAWVLLASLPFFL